MHELSDVKSAITHRLHPYVKHIETRWDEHNDSIYYLSIHLSMGKNYASNYSFSFDKDMRAIIPRINNYLKKHYLVKSFEYLQKPEPVYYTTQYLGVVINWNMGYTTDQIKIKLMV